jgi:hypothetical protein
MKTRHAALAACLTALSLLSCLDAGRPEIADLDVTPDRGIPGSQTRVRIEAYDASGGVWAVVTLMDSTRELGRVDCQAVPDSAGIYAGIWTADTAGLNHAEYIEFEAHAKGSEQVNHSGLIQVFYIVY